MGMADGLNDYSYARANPVFFSDPSGSDSEPPAEEKYADYDDPVTGAHEEYTRTKYLETNESVEFPDDKITGQRSNKKTPPPAKKRPQVQQKSPVKQPPVKPPVPPAPVVQHSEPQQTSGAGPSALERFGEGFMEGLGEGIVVGALAAGAVFLLPEIAIGLAVFGALSIGVGIGELITGEDLSGNQIDRANFAGHLVGGAAGAAVGGGLVEGVLPTSPSAPVEIPPKVPEPESVTIPEGASAPKEAPGRSTVPPRNPGERSLDYGTRVHQELPRIMRETNPKATGQFRVAPGLTGPDFVPNGDLNANFGEMKSMWDSQSRILGQARRWGFEPQTGRYFFYDEYTNTVIEGIFQTEKFPSGRFR
jgi:hypothetical protein